MTFNVICEGCWLLSASQTAVCCMFKGFRVTLADLLRLVSLWLIALT